MTLEMIAALWLKYATPQPAREDMLAALDEIERLAADNASLRAFRRDEVRERNEAMREVDRLRKIESFNEDHIQADIAQIEGMTNCLNEQKAEIERLRAGIKALIDESCGCRCFPEDELRCLLNGEPK